MEAQVTWEANGWAPYKERERVPRTMKKGEGDPRLFGISLTKKLSEKVKDEGTEEVRGLV